MKKYISLILSFVMLISMFAVLSGCSDKTSQGLEFKSNGDGTCTWVGLGTCTDTEIIVPEKNGEETVVSVGEEVLARKKGILKVVLPNTVKTIKEKAFAYNEELAEVVLGESVESIEDRAFIGCYNLENINLPKNLKRIGTLAFRDNKSLQEIVLPQGIEEIDYYAFEGTEKVTKISIPSSLKKFETADFSMTSVEEIEISEEFAYFHIGIDGDSAFGGVFKEDKGYYNKLDKENFNDVICALAGKKSIKINGQQVGASEPIPGKYEYNSYEIELTDEREITFAADDEIAVKVNYQTEEKTGRITATSELENNGVKAELLLNLYQIGDSLLAFAELKDTSGIYYSILTDKVFVKKS